MKQELAKEILDYIKIHQTVSTLELCDHYHLSESTVRRLLQRIEDSGQITRYHGGAIFNGEPISSEIQKRYLDNVDSKDKIAKRAAEMVKPGSTIIMLGGTTVFRMCKYLRNKAITVITNSYCLVLS